ncbi:MAG TPA: sodium:solute symporter family protein [Turneriella sp.]|nr:sodium:solute symporter family protein [Turneriella sp.]
MLLWGILGYLGLTLAVGFLAARRVKSSTDFALAGRNLSFFMASSTVFATWFGSETILGSSAEFAKHGFSGVVEEPFGAALCLILVGLFFARRLYRMRLNNLGEFYRHQFGVPTEIIASVIMAFSYLSWVAAQFLALGIVLNTISGLNLQLCIVLMAVLVTLYTTMGGMWAVSMTDAIQMTVIIIGLVVVFFVVASDFGGVSAVVQMPPPAHWNFLPEAKSASVIGFMSALMILGIGSIPGQDVFQRVMAAKNERIAVFSSIFSGILYFTVALIPLFLGFLALKTLGKNDAPADMQFLIPKLVLLRTNVVIQIVFFGALLSAILSTASGALLAPSVVLSENLLGPLFKPNDEKLLRISRISTVVLAAVSLVMALHYTKITELVSDSSAYGLVALFVPLVAGMYFKSTNAVAAIASILGGTLVWKLWPEEKTLLTPQLAGFIAALAPYAVLAPFTLVRRFYGKIQPAKNPTGE